MAGSSSCWRACAANSRPTWRNRRNSSPEGGPADWLINPASAAMRTARAGSSSPAMSAARRTALSPVMTPSAASAADRITGCSDFAAATTVFSARGSWYFDR